VHSNDEHGIKKCGYNAGTYFVVAVAQARMKKKETGIIEKIGAPPREGAPELPRLCLVVRRRFRRQLSDARITHLSGPKGAKCRIAIDLVESADWSVPFTGPCWCSLERSSGGLGR